MTNTELTNLCIDGLVVIVVILVIFLSFVNVLGQIKEASELIPERICLNNYGNYSSTSCMFPDCPPIQKCILPNGTELNYAEEYKKWYTEWNILGL